MNMDVPITLAIVLAVVTSLWETGLSGKHAYFDAALALTFFLLAGRWLDARIASGLSRRARQAGLDCRTQLVDQLPERHSAADFG